MTIPLNTNFEWEIHDLSAPSLTVLCFKELLEWGDILVVASYDPDVKALPFLRANSAKLKGVMKSFEDTIQANIKEYPNGAVFALRVTPCILESLAGLIEKSKFDYNLFIDHLIAFRLNKPALPLFYHHNLRHGYPLILSGHYSPSVVRKFCKCAGGSFRKRDRMK